MSSGVVRSYGTNLALLWLSRRPAATAPIQPLAWEPPYALGAVLKRPKNIGDFFLKFLLSSFKPITFFNHSFEVGLTI